MKLRRFLSALFLALFSLQMLNVAAFADEGMWTFNNVPRAEIKKKYGFEITDDWLKKVQMASVRFNNGGSGSFVSPNGLVLTNYHIVEDIVGEVSTPEKDLAKEGFLARTRADEIKIPSLELNVLMSIEDVTARVNGAVKPGSSDADAFAARRAANASPSLAPAFTAPLTREVTSSMLINTFNSRLGALISSARVRATKPSFARSFCGVLTSPTMSSTM